MTNAFRLMLLVLFASVATGCKTTDNDSNTPPAITAEMPLDQALEAGVRFGAETGEKVKKLIMRRAEWPQTMALLGQSIRDNTQKYTDDQLINAAALYMSSPEHADPAVFESLVGSARPLARQIGWHLASAMPSPAIAKAIDRELSRAIQESDEESVLIPQMAMAIQNNGILTGYTWVRKGLFENGGDEFAKAMISLNPHKASSDFLEYLSLAPAEELRQMTVSSVNLYSCLVILQHLAKVHAPATNPFLGQLFAYSVSRNIGLSQVASATLDVYIAMARDQMALRLAQLPVWVQIAYLEHAQRKLTPAVTVFLEEFKGVASAPEVVEEITETVR